MHAFMSSLMSRKLDLRARLLLGLCALLALTFITELHLLRGSDSALERAAVATTPAQLRADVSVPLAVPTEPLTAYAEVLRRPLFSVSREGQSASSEATTAAAGVAGRWRLTGVMLNAGSTLAILQPLVGGAAARPLRLQPGDSLEGWKLTEIEPNQVTLASGRATLKLRLHEPVPTTAGAAATRDLRRQRRP